MTLNIYDYFSKYSKDEVNLAINSLQVKYQDLLKKLYDEKGNFIDKEVLSRENYLDSEYLIIVVLPKVLEDIHRTNMTSIYDLFYLYDSDTVTNAIGLLDLAYQKIVLRREAYLQGKDDTYNLEDSIIFLQVILPRLEVSLREEAKKLEKEETSKEQQKRYKNLYILFMPYRKEEVDSVIEDLKSEEKELLWYRYDKNGNYNMSSLFLDKDQKRKIDYLVNKRIKKELKRRSLISLLDSNLFTILREYPKEEIESAIRNLTSEEREYLFMKYDGKYNVKSSFKRVNSFYNSRISYLITQKLPRLITKGLAKTDITSLYVLFENHTRAEIEDAIRELEVKEFMLLNTYYKSLKLVREPTDEVRKTLEIIIFEDLQRLLALRSAGPASISLYVKFNRYTKEEIDNAITTLSEEELCTLGLRYDADLNVKENANYLPKETIKEIDKAVLKIKKILRNQEIPALKDDDLFVRYKDYSRRDVLLAIESLTPKERDVLNRVYNCELKKRSHQESLSYSDKTCYKNLIYHKIPRLLANKEGNLSKLGFLIRFREYSKKSLIAAINSLSSEERELLSLRYDNNYAFLETSVDLDNETKNAIYLVVIKLEKILKNKAEKEIYYNDLFFHYSNYKPEEILEVIRTLNADDKKLFYLRYDESFNLRNDFKDLEMAMRQRVYTFLNGRFTRMLVHIKLTKDKDIYATKRLMVTNFVLENPYLKKINEVLDNKVVLILLMKLGYANGIIYPDERICSMLGVDQELITLVSEFYFKDKDNHLKRMLRGEKR